MKMRPGGLDPKWSHSLDRLVSRSRRKDNRDFLSKLVTDAHIADKRNDKAEAARLTRILTQKPRKAYWRRQPTVAPDGTPILTDEDLVRAWTGVRSNQFRARLIPADVEAPSGVASVRAEDPGLGSDSDEKSVSPSQVATGELTGVPLSEGSTGSTTGITAESVAGAEDTAPTGAESSSSSADRADAEASLVWTCLSLAWISS